MLPTTEELLREFDQQGYVIVRGLLDIELDLRPVYKEYTEVLDALAEQWYAQGHIASVASELPFEERIVRLAEESEQPYDLNFDISLPQKDIQEDTPIHHGPATLALLRSPRLLDVVELFVGPEIYSNPVQHTRVKIPESRLPYAARTGLTGQVAWHQDLGVITNDADATETLTVWIPMTDAAEDNGCLRVVPRSHRDELSLHCKSPLRDIKGQVSIPDRLIPDRHVPMIMQPGDVLFMHRRMQHTGTPNLSDRLRWSFDLRYHRIGEPTGRQWFPGFVARSRANPDSELRDAETWAQLWRDARHKLAQGKDPTFNRWANDDSRCA